MFFIFATEEVIRIKLLTGDVNDECVQLLSDEPFAADLPPGSTLKRATPPSPLENKVSTVGLLTSESLSLFPILTPTVDSSCSICLIF